jgi:hypothetical protein
VALGYRSIRTLRWIGPPRRDDGNQTAKGADIFGGKAACVSNALRTTRSTCADEVKVDRLLRRRWQSKIAEGASMLGGKAACLANALRTTRSTCADEVKVDRLLRRRWQNQSPKAQVCQPRKFSGVCSQRVEANAFHLAVWIGFLAGNAVATAPLVSANPKSNILKEFLKKL